MIITDTNAAIARTGAKARSRDILNFAILTLPRYSPPESMTISVVNVGPENVYASPAYRGVPPSGMLT
jgi:hypothetical protein